MSNHYQIEVEQQPVELYKLLKIANLVSGGGEAKVVISEGYVLLNGEVEWQKRKKIYAGDIIEFNGDLIELQCDAEPTITLPRQPKNKTANQHAKPEKAKNNHIKTANKAKPANQHAKPEKAKNNHIKTANKAKPAKQQPTKQKSIQAPQNNGKRRAINFDN